MKIIVCQHGARRGYAVAKMLEEAGMLAALYTDTSAHSFLGKAARLCKLFAGRRLGRLLQREPGGVPPEKVFSSDWPSLSDVWVKVRPRREGFMERHLRRHRILSRKMKRWGLQNADVVYSHNIEDYEFVEYAKRQGKQVATDVYEDPTQYRRLLPEFSKYPGCCPWPESTIVEKAEACFRRSAEAADLLLCPSEWVAENVRLLTPEHSAKIRICPYGSSINYENKINRPVEGRIFWAGGAWVRKGLPALAAAADVLKQVHPELDFRIAGLIDHKFRLLPDFRHLNFLGKLSRSEMQKEFLSADMFVLPTRSEGLAGVVLEAIAAGCPVITTRQAGIAITDRVDGMVVTPGDVEGLVEAIEAVYCDRNLRDTLAANTRALAFNYTVGAWKKRLVGILGEL